MNEQKAIETMRDAFAKLPLEARENLVYHAEHYKGDVLCGSDATAFVRPGGA